MSNIQFPTVVEGRFGSVVAGLAEAGRHDPMNRRFPLAKDAERAKEERGRAGNGNPIANRLFTCLHTVFCNLHTTSVGKLDLEGDSPFRAQHSKKFARLSQYSHANHLGQNP